MLFSKPPSQSTVGRKPDNFSFKPSASSINPKQSDVGKIKNVNFDPNHYTALKA